MFSFLCIVKQKKNLERSENFWKMLFLKIYIIKNLWKVGFQFILILGLCTLMLRWYLSRSPHFYSDWLWPYCDIMEKKLKSCTGVLLKADLTGQGHSIFLVERATTLLGPHRYPKIEGLFCPVHISGFSHSVSYLSDSSDLFRY